GVIVALLAGQAAMQQILLWPKWKTDYAPAKGMEDTPGLDPGQFLIALAGFREMVAGILWVRADAFFDAGNYDAILPIIRLVTILDPHQIDVYATGMWHIGYNFTDEEQRSDRRYLPTALALGAEGSKQNPSTYELYFETGWMWLHKIDDIYPKAVEWMQAANDHDDMPPARRNMLARAYEKDGDIEKMIDLYYKLYDEAEKKLKKDPAYQNRQGADVIENNLDNLLVRSVQRGYQAKKLGIYDSGDYDTKPPFDVGFTAKVTVTEANIIRIEGTWNVQPLGTRIKVILRDKDFPNAVAGGAIWDAWKGVNLDPDKNATYMQDQLYVRNQHFNKKIDMSKDPTMYPFVGKDYTLEFFYNPRSAPPHIQDKFGWNGEGMTDKNFLRDDLKGPGRDGVRCMYTTLHLTRDMIKRQGEWADKVPVLMTKGYKDSGSTGADQDVIIIPSLRGSK
ncbi:MAG TPA: hypothetical protein VG820_08090, partial [Fimbriimonadaceae bacterium]|nr:hypothetical protein [Fimbriimonadaceae bacterium]